MKFVQPIRDPEVVEAIQDDLLQRSARDYIFFCMGVYSGLRVSDLLELRAGMVRGSHVTLIEQKKDKRKQFIIHSDIRSELNDYIDSMTITITYSLPDKKNVMG